MADPDISFGGPRGAEGARIEAPRGVGCGEGLGVESGEGASPSPENFFNLLLKNGLFWSILISKCASHVYTCLAYFYFHQYKPTS